MNSRMFSFMLSEGRIFKVGDYVYVIEQAGKTLDLRNNLKYKKKIPDINFVKVQYKLGIPLTTILPNLRNNRIFKVISVKKYTFEVRELVIDKDEIKEELI